jgi:hypothetical protein
MAFVCMPSLVFAQGPELPPEEPPAQPEEQPEAQPEVGDEPEAEPQQEPEPAPAPKPEAEPRPKLTPKEALIRARAAFEELRLGAIRPLLEPILEPEPRLEDKADRLEARILLGVSLFIEAESLNDEEREKREELLDLASKQFLEALREDPELELDSQLYPRIVIDYFESVRSENKDELDRLREKNGNGPNKTGISDTIYIERATRKHYKGLNLLPFGYGQFQNGHIARGTFYATVQAGALATNVAFYLRQYQLVYQVGGEFPLAPDGSGASGEARLVADRARVGMYVSLGVFAAFYLLSVADGLYFYEPEKVEYLRTLPGPPPELDPNNRLPAAPMQFEWRWRF